MSNEPNIWAARLNGIASVLVVVGGFGLIAIVVIVFVGVLVRYVFTATDRKEVITRTPEAELMALPPQSCHRSLLMPMTQE